VKELRKFLSANLYQQAFKAVHEPKQNIFNVKIIIYILVIHYTTNYYPIPMRPNRLFAQKHIGIITVSTMFMLHFSSMNVHAQTPTNFSGNWEFDKAKSDAGFVESTYEGTVVRHMSQNAATIKYSDTYIHPDRPDFNTASETYSLDGKEKVEKHSVGTSKKSAKWSQDKKVLIITNLDTQKLKGVPKDFLVVDSLKLSENKLTLTIIEYSKNPVRGETTARKVYSKK